MKRRLVFARTIMALVILFAWSLPGLSDEGKDESGRGKERGPRIRHEGEGEYGTYFKSHGRSNLGIPEGHLPPPGECRIWYPDKPAGHQPPPGNCEQLRREVPADAWLIVRPKEEPAHVNVSVYDHYRPGIVISIGIFDVDTGAIIREIKPRGR